MTTSIKNYPVLALMHVEVRNRSQEPRELRSWARKLATESLERFSTHIRKVVVRVQDLNGPKGGIDKEASISLHMVGGATKLVRHRAGTYEAAFGMALSRAKQVLQRCQHVGARKPRLRYRGAR